MIAIKNKIKEFTPISLKEIAAVSLMKRTDTKFVIPMQKLAQVLESIGKYYKVLQIDDNRIMQYSSMYYDTANKDFYTEHHNGKINRVKVRIRKYVDSNISFLEIKEKDGKGRTNKSRIAIDGFEEKLSEESNSFIKKVTGNELDLHPTLTNNFDRITLANTQSNERVTIDLNLTFSQWDKVKKVENLVIIEVKQEGVDRTSEIIKALKSLHYNSYSMSKYCIGMLGLYKGIKYNRFKQKLIKINKLTA